MKWYHASNDGSNQLTVHFNAENHGSKVGSYIAHAYITYTDGNRVGVNLGKRKLSLSAPQLSLKQGGLQLFSKLKPGAADQLFQQFGRLRMVKMIFIGTRQMLTGILWLAMLIIKVMELTMFILTLSKMVR